MKRIANISIAIFLSVLTVGCVTSIDNTIGKYNKVAHTINLGDSKVKVLSILLPTQEELDPEYSKLPEKYKKDNKLYEIYYMRSLRQADGYTTDDEFTPYMFIDNKLESIGWSGIGGASGKGIKR